MPDLSALQLTWISAAASAIAAGVAIFLAAWTVARDVRNKGRLKIECGYSFDQRIHEREPDANPMVPVFRITNIGSQPITVKRIKLQPRGQRFFLEWEHKNLPRILQPSEFVGETFRYDFVKHAVSKVVVADSSGKEWRASRKQVRKLLEAPVLQRADDESERSAA